MGSKRRNSTKQPLISGTVKTCNLKEDCSILNPVLIIAGNNFSYDYAYISDFGRYYFVTDVISKANNLTEIRLTVDVLASFKTTIGATKAFIAYASNNYNAFIVDPRAQVNTVKLVQTDESGLIFTDTGHYIVSVFNKFGHKALGLCSAYYCDDYDLPQLASFIASNNTAINQFFNGNLTSGISSIIWVPYTIPADYLDNASKFAIGDVQDSSVWTVDEVTSYARYTDTVNLQWNMVHPNDFRRSDPFSKGLMYLPGVGNVEVNLTDFTGSNYITVRYVIELLTGDISYFLENSAGKVIQSYFTNVASPIPIGSTTVNASGAVNSGIGIIGGTGAALAGIATGNIGMALGGAGAAVASASSAAIAANQKTTTVSGGMGGRGVTVKRRISLTVFTMDTEDITAADYLAVKGRPVGEVHLISSHSGYVQTLDAHIAGSMTNSERENIEGLLNSGIYYE